ncbi:MAG: class I SAM-dependent methyltransferase [Legionellales bacterium]|nr:class I SAM-dependent methyltransferase [Legionellales bacterium]
MIRPFSKFAAECQKQGAPERRTGAYTRVCEDSSTGATQLLTAAAEFRTGSIKRDAASFRDPAGHVYWQNDHVYRTVMPIFASAFDEVRQSNAIENWMSNGILWPEQRVDKNELGEVGYEAYAVLKHPVLPLITYPYEWPFPLLKEAALFHLDLMLDALSKNIMLNDASAFNIQFNGVKPVFIDHLAFRPYVEGEFWQAHKQFFEQFINPLLLQAYTGIAFQEWYRGKLSGIATGDLAKILPFKRKLNWRVGCHILLQAYFDKQTISAVSKKKAQRAMPRTGLESLWRSLRRWIATLEDGISITHWQAYRDTHSYDEAALSAKKTFVREFISKTQPELLWDIGCNDGLFSLIALEAGAKRVIGFDNDHGALAAAFNSAKAQNGAFTPLYMDLTNPTPAQGWCENERLSLMQRNKPTAILALALVHHLAITANIPLPLIIDYLLSLAPRGVVEFVPKSDQKVQAMLAQREDIFVDYHLENFVNLLSAKAKIVSQISLAEGGRVLIEYTHKK